MKRSSTIIGTCFLLVAIAVAQDKPKVEATDVQTWERALDLGEAFDEVAQFNWTNTWGCPRAKEMLSTFNDQCRQVQWVGGPHLADYVLVFDKQNENEVAVFTAETRDLVVRKSAPSLNESIQQACDAIAVDWASNRDTNRASTTVKDSGPKAENAKAIGSVTGVVVDENGHPMSGAIAYLRRMGVRSAEPAPHTGSNGRFSASDLEWGTYYVVAENQAAGYTDEPNNWSVFQLSPEHPQATLTVQSGKKAGILLLTAVDATSGQPVKDARVQTSCECPSQTRNTATGKILLPPDREMTLRVSAPGYEEWRYTTGTGRFRLEPEQQLTLEVPLKRLSGSPAK